LPFLLLHGNCIVVAWAFGLFADEIGGMEKQSMTSKEVMPNELSR
jgi:hypothetical protein